MTMYEYKCNKDKCKKDFQEDRKIDERKKKIDCPHCKKGTGDFQMSSGSFRIENF